MKGCGPEVSVRNATISYAGGQEILRESVGTALYEAWYMGISGEVSKESPAVKSTNGILRTIIQSYEMEKSSIQKTEFYTKE